MADWHDFFVAQVGAAAALAGLVFVGVSINLTKIMSYPSLPGLAGQTLILLAAVLIVSSLLLVPGQPLWLVGLETLGVGLVLWMTVVVIHFRILKNMEATYRNAFIIRIILAQIAMLPFLVAGGFLMAGSGDGIYWIVPANLGCFIVSLFNSWVLLIEINR